MIKSEIKTIYKTKYHLELIDSKTGEVKRKCDTHNVFTIGWWNSTLDSYGSPDGSVLIDGIHLGSGTGTPAESDTALFSELWSISNTYTVTMDTENKQISVLATGSVPATSSYTGTVTEIGLWSRTAGGGGAWATPIMITHALLLDAEGNPISIEKADTDILTVTALLEIGYAASSPWELIKYPGMLLSELITSGRIRNQWVSVFFSLGTTQPDTMSYGKNNGAFYYPDPTAFQGATGSMNRSAKTLTFATSRAGTSIGENRPVYFNYLMFTGFCYAELPNANLFSYYDITGAVVGTGDGTTTEFSNPYDYFIENSETVYKNGTALVRGVDYTIDYRNNKNRLPELAATCNASLSGGVTISRGTYGGNKQMLFQRLINNVSRFLVDPVSVGWTASAPLLIELESASDVNTFYVPGWVATGTITLSKSLDGETYTQVEQVDHVSGTADTVTFSTVSSKYWKIEGTNASWTSHEFTTDDMTLELFLGYVGDPYITFTTAPDEGDEITMDVRMDRPFKNGNFVIDISAVLQLS